MHFSLSDSPAPPTFWYTSMLHIAQSIRRSTPIQISMFVYMYAPIPARPAPTPIAIHTLDFIIFNLYRYTYTDTDYRQDGEFSAAPVTMVSVSVETFAAAMIQYCTTAHRASGSFPPCKMYQGGFSPFKRIKMYRSVS